MPAAAPQIALLPRALVEHESNIPVVAPELIFDPAAQQRQAQRGDDYAAGRRSVSARADLANRRSGRPLSS
jgi:hypothetical protein